VASCPPDPLVAPTELSQWGVPAPFLSQFRLRPFEVQISRGGTLGAMAIRYRMTGEEEWSPEEVMSESGSSWGVALDDAFAQSAPATFAVMTFPAGDYPEETSYVVGADGTVTLGDSAISGPTATRTYLPAQGCSAVTAEALQLMQNAIVPPLTAWPDSFKRHAAAMVHAFLKRSRGSTGRGSGSGADNGDDVLYAAEALARDFFIMVNENGKPPGTTDTSVPEESSVITSYPLGIDERNWRDAY